MLFVQTTHRCTTKLLWHLNGKLVEGGRGGDLHELAAGLHNLDHLPASHVHSTHWYIQGPLSTSASTLPQLRQHVWI